MLRRSDIDLIIIGEAREWETVEYVRDAVQLGQQKGMIILGHAVSEEEGMHYCAQWLSTFIDEVPVYFVEAGDPFHP
jgi:Tfp pilus assembly ATPase PilU